MARLWSSGFELNTTTAGVEWDSSNGAPAISTSTVRTGTYAAQITSLASTTRKGFRETFTPAANGPFFSRVYFNFATLPSAENTIYSLVNGTSLSAAIEASVTIDSTGALRLYYNNAGTSTVIGSASSTLNTGQWYRIEMKFDRSPAGGSQVVNGLLDGTQFAGSSSLTINAQVRSLCVGGNLNAEAQTTGNWFIDDVAVNDSTGASQTGLPGVGQIVHLRPSAAGDNNAFTVQVGGVAGSTNNFTRVKEVTPNDATDYNADLVNTNTDDFVIDATPSTIGPSDTINVVGIGVRFSGAAAITDSGFKVRCKKVSGGTVSSSAQITPTSTTWITNAIGAGSTNHPLVLYNDPDSNPWKKGTLNTAQIGYTITTAAVNAAQISTVWMMVDSTPVSSGGTPLLLMGVGT